MQGVAKHIHAKRLTGLYVDHDDDRLTIPADTITAEGLENALSVTLVRRPTWKIVGLPGIAALKHMPTRSGERVIHFQDSDPPDSPAATAREAAVDERILAGARMSVTEHVP